jgi:hypothetical protein
MLFFLASRLMLENSSRRFRPEDSGQIFIDLKRFAKTVYFQHVQLYVGSLFLNMIILQKLSKNQVFDLFNSLSVFIIQANQKTISVIIDFDTAVLCSFIFLCVAFLKKERFCTDIYSTPFS